MTRNLFGWLKKDFFFRPTPSWLSPGRLTRSIHAEKMNLQIIMPGRLEADGHKRELVMDLYIVQQAVPSKATKQQKTQNKNLTQKTKNTKNKQKKRGTATST